MPNGLDTTGAIVGGAGLAGLVATAELADSGRKVMVVDQEPEASLGGQAFWSLGGLMLVDSPEQRRLRIRASHALAWQDWLGTAGFDRPEDEWPRRWAEAYVEFTAGEKRAWLAGQGVKFMPNVSWAERGGYLATGHGNSVPRFHITWGTGPGVLEPFIRRVRDAQSRGLVDLRFRHKVDAPRSAAAPSPACAVRCSSAVACSTEGVHNWDPIWTDHGIRIIPGPSSLWLDAGGQRLPPAAVPRLRHAGHTRAHHGHRPRLHVVRADPEDHREGVRALRLRAEPGPHRARPAPSPHGPARLGRARAGRGVQAPRRRLRGGARPAGRWCAA